MDFKLRRTFRWLLLVSILILGVRLVLVVWLNPVARAWFTPEYWRASAQLGEVMRIVHTQYVDPEKATYERLTGAARDAMLQQLDRYSDYLDAEAFADFEVGADQRYAGIGVEIERVNRRITVGEVFPGSPAGEAGVRPGDQIVGVNGEDMRGATLPEIVTLLRGPEGTAAQVTFYRPSAQEEFTVPITRRHIDFPTLRDVKLGEDGIAYMRVTQFGRRTAGEVGAALDELEAKGMQGLILDLRNNPGGLLPAAVALTGQFVPKGEKVATTRGRGKRAVQEEFSPGPGRMDFPVAVLMNPHSASASEIVAGALQDLGRAFVVGERSVGKGSVQSVLYRNNQEGLRLTTARYYLPSGRTIEETGVVPDIEVPVGVEERWALLTQRGWRDLTATEFRERFGVERVPDRQREAAESVLRGVLAFEGGRG